MAFIARYEVSGSFLGAEHTVSLGAFVLARIAAVNLSVNVAGGTNNDDTQVTAQLLPGTGEVRLARVGTAGTVTFRFTMVTDTLANTQAVRFTSLAAGANNAPISAVNLAQSYIIPLGIACEGNRNDASSAALNLSSTTNLEASCWGAPVNAELNALVVDYTGAVVQNVTSTSNASAGVGVSAVDLARTFHYATSRPAEDAASWPNNNTDTSSFINNTTLQFFRATGGGVLTFRRAFVVTLPAGVLQNVQRATDRAFAPAATFNWVVSSVPIARSLAKGGGLMGQYNYSDSTATNTDQDRSAGTLQQTSDVQVRHERTSIDATWRIAFELLTWNEPAPSALYGGARRRKKRKKSVTLTPRTIITSQVLPAAGADLNSIPIDFGELNQPNQLQLFLSYATADAAGAYEAQVQLTYQDPATATDWFSVPAFDETTPTAAAPDIDVTFGAGNWVNVGVPAGTGRVRLTADVAGARAARLVVRESGAVGDPGTFEATAAGQ